MDWIDCHCHLSLSEVSDEVLESMLAECKSLHINRFVLGGYDPVEWARQLRLAEKYSAKFFFSAGIHPWNVQKASDQELKSWLEHLETQLTKVHFVGELGLDKNFMKSEADSRKQIEIFKSQLSLAKKFNKPVMLHAVGMHDEILNHLSGFKGYVHAFSGEWSLAKRYLDLGIKLSFDPRSLLKSGDVIKKISKNDFLIESDAPNRITKSPAEILSVAETVASLRLTTLDEILNQVSKNFDELVVQS